MKIVPILIVTCLMSVPAFALMDLEISINGDLNPPDSQYTLSPGGTAVLNIHSIASYDGMEDIYWALVCDTAAGTITGGTPTAAAPSDSSWLGDDAQLNGLVTAPEDGSWGYIGSIAGTPADPGVYIDDISFVCESDSQDAILNLYTTVDFETFTLADTAVIHQVPEPMTMALLGLGGLLLRKRCK